MNAGTASATTRQDRFAWVIGGSSGIGEATVHLLHSKGWNVIASGCHGPALQPLGDRRWTVGVDVRNEASVRDTAERLRLLSGGLDAVILSVRDPASGNWHSLNEADWQASIDTKLLGYARVARMVLDQLAQKNGTLVNIIGSAATVASAQHPLGCINAALRHLTRSMALEWGPKGARIIGISPGPTATNTLNRLIGEAAEKHDVHPDAFIESMVGPMFRNRMITPDEIAEIVVWALQPGAAPLNGTVLLADDGASGGSLS